MAEYPSGDPSPSPDSSGTGIEKKKTSPWVWVAIVAAVLIVAALAAYSASSGGGILWLFGRQNVEVPLVLGQTQTDAESAITTAGLQVGQVSKEETLGVAPGLVVAQSPAASTKAKEGSAVDITVSALPVVKIPDVIGNTESDASLALAEQGLRIGAVSYEYSSTEPGRITAQDPQADTEAVVGSAVDIVISKGVQQGQVPNVVGLAQTDAESTLEGAGFKVVVTKSTNADVPAGNVISQSPAAGVVVAAGSTVTITVSTGAPAAPAEPTPPVQPAEPTPPASETAIVPDVVGMRAAEAVRALKDANLKFSIKFETSTENFLKVAAQDPKAGAEVDPGTSVTIIIGLPSFTFEKPSVEPTTLPAPAPPAGEATTGS